METFFLVCFVFGALFTVASVVLGFAHLALPGADVGHFGHFGSGSHHLPSGHAGHAGHAGPTGSSVTHAASHAPGSDAAAAPHVQQSLSLGPLQKGRALFNVSSLLAFLTWFGAAGYLLLSFALWALPAALAGAVVFGGAGAALIALFLRTVLAGEREMDPRDYRRVGTLARVTVGIPPGGVGEIVFIKGGVRRSEAARSRHGQPIARHTEVVILDHSRGVAAVEPWDELMKSERGSLKDED